MENSVKINIVSDVVCPWCLIGYKRLQQAITEMELQDKVEIIWEPFELNPGLPAEGIDQYLYRSQKYGASNEETDVHKLRLAAMAEAEGFKFDLFDGMKIINTKNAHILLDYAKGYGLQTELNSRLVASFFSERKDISDKDVQYKELLAVGLNADEGIKKLDDTEARKHVEQQLQYWKNQGVSGVPTMYFNDSEPVGGAQSVASYKQVLAEVLANQNIEKL